MKRKREQNTPLRYTLVFGLGALSAGFGFVSYTLFQNESTILGTICGVISVFYTLMTHFTLNRFKA